VIFQFEYARLGSMISVDVFAGSDPEALDFCGTVVFAEAVFMAFQESLQDEIFTSLHEIYFVDLDKS
jgi:hypothetical protein